MVKEDFHVQYGPSNPDSLEDSQRPRGGLLMCFATISNMLHRQEMTHNVDVAINSRYCERIGFT